jgi:hypothetical protein
MIDRRGAGGEVPMARNRSDLSMLALSVAAVAAACAVLLATIPTVGAEATQGEEAAPRIEFEETIFDFGTMYQYQEVDHAFKFRNTGTAQLKIEKVRSSCGCTAALPQELRLAPGEETTLDITFRTGSYRDRIAKRIYVDSNDPVEPRVILTIEGEVLVEINISPRGIYIGRLEIGETVHRFVEITPQAAERFEILSVESDNPLVRVGDPLPLEEDRPGYKLPIEIGPVEEPARFRAKIKVRTDLEYTKEFQISVYARTAAAKADDAAAKTR